MTAPDTVSRCHPAVSFAYFALVIGFSMFLLHPVCLALSLCGAALYQARLRGGRALWGSVRWLLPLLLLTALINPAFTHKGVTILTYLPSGNPLTLESILYGLAAAVLLSAVVLWFGCFSDVMTSDKFLYLFGRLIPALSLVLSMTLRFVPRFTRQFRAVAQAQRCMGRDTENGTVRRRVRSALRVFSIMVTWSLESAIDTADSMRSRGYGLPGRTAFHLYRWDDRDRALAVWLALCGLYLLGGAACGALSFTFYPMLTGAALSPLTVSFFAVYAALCFTPLWLNAAAQRRLISAQKGGTAP